ncbi:MAG: tRNA 2-thiouridine(34) synthase MnmA [Nitrospirae bacterium]|nr:tRNA 2-thiouridine(34) synthase MnmA [Nitrospirota bacterium]
MMNKSKKKAIVAMSGGVDSSVAAYLLQKDGYEVIGLSFELWDKRDITNLDACCSIETINIARKVAQDLGIEHHTVDVRDNFYEDVIKSFCASYIEGLTPNPCILCNKFIKFDFLLKKAEELDADIVATGHYARIVRNPEPADRHLLLKGIDPKKDQSYVLYAMTQKELSKTVFPLGGLKKDKTREIAKELGLANALRAESQEICFVGDIHYADFIKEYAPGTLIPGQVLNMEGKVLGEHKGIAFYTIGQRKGLGIQSLMPSYVIDIDPKKNIITIGGREDALRKSFKVNCLNWISIEELKEPLRAKVKVRSTMTEAQSTLMPDGDSVNVEFDEPQWAPAPGQSAVFYDGDTVIGGGVIQHKNVVDIDH